MAYTKFWSTFVRAPPLWIRTKQVRSGPRLLRLWLWWLVLSALWGRPSQASNENFTDQPLELLCLTTLEWHFWSDPCSALAQPPQATCLLCSTPFFCCSFLLLICSQQPHPPTAAVCDLSPVCQLITPVSCFVFDLYLYQQFHTVLGCVVCADTCFDCLPVSVGLLTLALFPATGTDGNWPRLPAPSTVSLLLTFAPLTIKTLFVCGYISEILWADEQPVILCNNLLFTTKFITVFGCVSLHVRTDKWDCFLLLSCTQRERWWMVGCWAASQEGH